MSAAAASANPLKSAAAFETSLDDLGKQTKEFSNSAAGKKEAADAAREARIAEEADKQDRTVVLRVDKEALEAAFKAALAKLSGAGADALEGVTFGAGRGLPPLRVVFAEKEQADAVKEAIGEDGHTLKGKEATGGLKIASAKGVAVPSRSIHFANPVAMPVRNVPGVGKAPKPYAPAEGAEVDEEAEAAAAAATAEYEAKVAARDAAREQQQGLYDAFRDDLIGMVRTLFSAPGGGADDETAAQIEDIKLDGANFVVSFADRASVVKAKAGFFEPLTLDRHKLGPVREGFPSKNQGAGAKRPRADSKGKGSNSGNNSGNMNGNRKRGANNNNNNNGGRGGRGNNNNNRNNNNNNNNNNRGGNQSGRGRNNNNNNRNNNRSNQGSNKRRRR
jgi:hypothetical protein